MMMPGRDFYAGYNYRYGFQNQEIDKEIWGGAVFYKYRVEDPRIVRFFSVDPLYKEYPANSQYAFSENRVIDAVELEGLEADVLYAITPEDNVIKNSSDDIRNLPNVLTVVSHAGPHGARIVENNQKMGLIDGPSSFNKQMSKDSEKWKNRSEANNLVVVMFGCNLARDRVVTEKDKNGYTVKVKELPTRIQIISAGHPDQVFIGSETSVIFSENFMWDKVEGPESGGYWRVYKAGKLIDEYPSSWNPIQNKSKWFDNPKEIKSTSIIPPATGQNGDQVPDCNEKKCSPIEL